MWESDTVNQTPMISVGECALPFIDALVRDADRLRLRVSQLPGGSTFIDAGIECQGGIEAGRRLVELCLAGLGSASIGPGGAGASVAWPFAITVASSQPVLACLASQYAGWQLKDPAGGKFNALGSGPARALARSEALFDDLGYTDRPVERAVLVLEADRSPPAGVVDRVAQACALPAQSLVFVVAPTTSMAGLTQVVGRVLETALHKAHALDFPLSAIVDGIGSAPLCPPSPDFLTSMSRGNDAILFGGRVQLLVDADDDSASDLARRLPCTTSSDYGRPFGELFKAAGFDFYKIDPMLFAPAQVLVTNLRSGRSFSGGHLNDELLARAFGGPE